MEFSDGHQKFSANNVRDPKAKTELLTLKFKKYDEKNVRQSHMQLLVRELRGLEAIPTYLRKT